MAMAIPAHATHDGNAEIRSLLGSMVIKTSRRHEICNPAPLGLLGFALTTAILQGSVTGISGVTTSSWAVAFSLFFGGAAQAIAGIIDAFRLNMFGFTAFTTYGAFWMSFAIYNILTRSIGVNGQPILQPSLNGEQFMLGAFALITFIFFLCTFAMNAVLTALFFSLACLLLGTGVLFCTALIAMYAAAAELINDSYNKQLLPLFFWHKKEHMTDPDEPDLLDLQPRHPHERFAGHKKQEVNAGSLREENSRIVIAP